MPDDEMSEAEQARKRLMANAGVDVSAPAPLPTADPMYCPRCHQALRFAGTQRFHEGTRQWGFWLGDLGELFVNRESFDVYVCPRCGRVEFFVEGIGDEFRPR